MIRLIGPLLFDAPPKTVVQKTGAGIGAAGLHLLVALVLAFAMPWPLLRMLSGIAAALQ
jgi:hypothetical protein